MSLLVLFPAVLKASALSIGGLASVPLLRQDIVAAGLASEHQLLESLTIGRLSPGPGGLYRVSLGYFAAGANGCSPRTHRSQHSATDFCPSDRIRAEATGVVNCDWRDPRGRSLQHSPRDRHRCAVAGTSRRDLDRASLAVGVSRRGALLTSQGRVLVLGCAWAA